MLASLHNLSRLFAWTLVGVGVTSIATSAFAQHAQRSTKKEQRSVGGVAMFGVAGEREFFTRGRLAIDADGAPNAYHPGFACDASGQQNWKLPVNVDCASKSTEATCRGFGFTTNAAYGATDGVVHCKWKAGACSAEAPKRNAKRTQGGCWPLEEAKLGLDDLENAGHPGSWAGIVVDKKSGAPFVQKAGDPFPGFYVSGTKLHDATYAEWDARRYVDSTKINYVALPPHTGAELGDIVVVVHWRTKKVAYAVFGDLGSAGWFEGEGSVALAAALGLGSNPRAGGTDQQEIVYVAFPGTHLVPRFPRAQGNVDAIASAAFAAWGGVARLEALNP